VITGADSTGSDRCGIATTRCGTPGEHIWEIVLIYSTNCWRFYWSGSSSPMGLIAILPQSQVTEIVADTWLLNLASFHCLRRQYPKARIKLARLPRGEAGPSQAATCVCHEYMLGLSGTRMLWGASAGAISALLFYPRDLPHIKALCLGFAHRGIDHEQVTRGLPSIGAAGGTADFGACCCGRQAE